MPVSYTHLDVYKRQDEMNMIISLYAQTCGVPQVITKVGHMENNSMQDSLGPVSYTHLDVYKRQRIHGDSQSVQG